MVAGWPDLFTAVPLSGAEFDTETGSSASGLVLFFLVLLSLAEHIGFGWAYLIGDVRVHRHDRRLCVALATRNGATAAVIGAILILLYSALYTLLQLEEYSLLLGTALLVILLGALMVATRSLNREPDQPERNAWKCASSASSVQLIGVAAKERGMSGRELDLA